MQKLFNVMSVAAFTMSAGMVIGTVMLYTSIPSLTKRYVSQMKQELTETLLKSMPVPEVPEMPGLPTETGPAIKSPF
jgi:hypothetical protein